MGIREEVSDGQAKQAARMFTRSSKYLDEVEIGDYVALQISNMNRSVSSSPHIICRIIDIDYHHNLHELACPVEVLSVMFAPNCFENIDSAQLGVK